MDAAETVLSLTLTVAVPMKSKKAKRKENRDPDSKAAQEYIMQIISFISIKGL